MTRPFREEEIELFIRAPDDLPPFVRDRIRRLLDEDDEARAVADSIRAFYESLQEGQALDADALARLVDHLCAPGRVIRLHSVTHRRQGSRGREMPQTLMAAASEAISAPRLLSTSFAAEDSNVMVRLLHDRQSGTCRVYVMADEPAARAYALVSFHELSMLVPTDELGRAEFDAPAGVEAESWADFEAVVRLAVASYPVDPFGIPSLDHEGGVRGIVLPEHAVELRRTNETVRLRVSGREAGSPIVSIAMFQKADGAYRVVELSDGEALVESGFLNESAVLRLYV